MNEIQNLMNENKEEMKKSMIENKEEIQKSMKALKTILF
jgi:hypothetical protein